jgi:hypothetical protein
MQGCPMGLCAAARVLNAANLGVVLLYVAHFSRGCLAARRLAARKAGGCLESRQQGALCWLHRAGRCVLPALTLGCVTPEQLTLRVLTRIHVVPEERWGCASHSNCSLDCVCRLMARQLSSRYPLDLGGGCLLCLQVGTQPVAGSVAQ